MLAETMTMTTILMVEDSMLLRAANMSVLARAGCTVLMAETVKKRCIWSGSIIPIW